MGRRTVKTLPAAADKKVTEKKELMNQWMVLKKEAEVNKSVANMLGDAADPFSTIKTGFKVSAPERL
jgi:hypothetical protein